MESVSSTYSATQVGLLQLRQQQARRNAEQAEQAAQSLTAQANEAQRVADRALETARSLAVQSRQAQARAGQVRQGLAAMSSAQHTVTQLSNTVDQVLDREQAPASTAQNAGTAQVSTSAAPVSSATAPGVNIQSPVTGGIVDTTA